MFRTAVRRFRPAAVLRARTLSSFGAFLKATKGQFPRDFKARAKAVAKAWNALSATEKAKYAKIGKKTIVKPKVKKARKANAFAKFVKAKYNSVKGSSAPERLKAIAKLWKAKH